MLVRIRLQHGPRVRPRKGTRRQFALAAAALLSPAALMAWVLAAWRLAADMQLTTDFAFNDGIFSHWQLWLAVDVFLLTLSAILNRYGRAGRSAVTN